MENHFARKVDQQLAFATVHVASSREAVSPLARDAMLQAACLQLALGIDLYLSEIGNNHRVSLTRGVDLASSIQRFGVDSGSLEAQELNALASNQRSWLSRLLVHLREFTADRSRESLKSPLFANDDVASDEADGNMIGAVQLNEDVQQRILSQPEIEECIAGFEELIQRHRNVNEEY